MNTKKTNKSKGTSRIRHSKEGINSKPKDLMKQLFGPSTTKQTAKRSTESEIRLKRQRMFRARSRKPLAKLNPEVADKILAWYKAQTEDTKLAVLLAHVMFEDFEGRDMLNEILNVCREPVYAKIQQMKFTDEDGDIFTWGIFAGIRGCND